MGQVLFRAFACGLAGLVAWLVTEPRFPDYVSSQFGATGDPRWEPVERSLIWLFGLLLGGTAGFTHGMVRGGRRAMTVSTILGACLGVVGATIGHGLAGGIFNLFQTTNRLFGVDMPMIGRTVAFTAFGLCLGLAIGGIHLTKRGILTGGLGGLIGGAITGALFDPISYLLHGVFTPTGPVVQQMEAQGMLPETGAPGRAVMTFGMGLLVGLFTSWAYLATRHAWLRLVLGRNEGKEWAIDSATTTLGRDERATIPLFSDPNVAPHHATIIRQGKVYWLQDAGTPVGTGLNGQRVNGSAPLQPGDTIQLAGLSLQFFMRGYAGARGPEGRPVAYPVQHAPQATPTPTSPGAPFGNATVAMPAASPPTQLGLMAIAGPLVGQKFAVNGPTEIGRESAGIRLPDPNASRRHASVTPVPGGLQVQDLGSTNGVLWNGTRVTSANAVLGDTLQIGQSVFRVESL